MNFSLEHNMEILEINLNNTENNTERKIAFIDSNRDLFLSPTQKRDIIKIQPMCDCFLWNDTNDILVGISDQQLVVWYYPNATYVDKDIMELCKFRKVLTSP